MCVVTKESNPELYNALFSKDEIKEILDNKLYFDLEEEDYIKIKDYITNLQGKLEYYENIDPDKTIDKFRQKINKEMSNLQEENKKLKHKLEQMYNDTKDTYNEICAEQVDYKSRNEKAIEYVERICESEKNINPYILHAPTLLNILQGSDKK